MSSDKPPKLPGRLPTNPDRDFLGPHRRKVTPLGGVPTTTPWHQEDTGVHTDTQVFRAMKGLHDELEKNKEEAARAHGALKGEVNRLSGHITELDKKVDVISLQAATMSGKMDVMLAMQRDNRSPSSSVQRTVTDVIAAHIVTEDAAAKKFKRALILKIAGGLFSAAVLGALVTYLLGRL